MCGIAGFTHADKPFDRFRIHHATESLRHRGPDQQDVWQSRTVSLGARRLRVLDHLGGDQPMQSEDGDVVAVFNGEIFNFRELRRDLEGAGHRFHSECDTEVVLRGFLEWGTSCFCKLRGMFAIGLWMESKRRLVLARDRMGIKPLYYARHKGDVYFGSELKAILVHPEIPRHIDNSGLTAYCGLNYVPGPGTLVQAIAKVPPGSTLTWEDGICSVRPYWNLDEQASYSNDICAASEQLDYLLTSAVREQLQADVDVGIWLSGGVDSSTVLHYAAQHGAKRPKTFSVTFPGREFDECAEISDLVGRYETDHFQLALTPEVADAEAIREFAYYADEPNADAGALPVWFLAKMSAKEVTVALSGEGADELFGGYITYQADICAGRITVVPRWMRMAALSLARKLPASDRKIGTEYKLQRFLEGSFFDDRAAHLYWNGTSSHGARAQLLLHPDETTMERIISEIPANGNVRRFLDFDRNYYLADNILAKVDRMSMAHSLEVRPPFLDHRIVEFAAGLPLTLLIEGRTLKRVLRHLMKDRLPHSVASRPKTGLDVPVHDWLRNHLRPLLMDTLTERAVKESGLFQWSYVQQMLDLHMQKRINHGYQLWGLLTLFLWMERWKVSANQDTENTSDFSTVSA
jgi:asparagine synthase (glutamine-hydrolysing)